MKPTNHRPQLSLKEEADRLAKKGIHTTKKVLMRWEDNGTPTRIKEYDLDDDSYEPSRKNREFYELHYFNGTFNTYYRLDENSAQEYGLTDRTQDHAAFTWRGILSKDSSAYMNTIFSSIREEINEDLKHVEFDKSKGSAKDGYYLPEQIEELADSNEIIICSEPEWITELRTAHTHLREALDIVRNNAGENGGVSNDLFKIIEHAFRAGEHKTKADKFDYLQVVNAQEKTRRAQKKNLRHKGKKNVNSAKELEHWQQKAISIFLNDPSITNDAWIAELVEGERTSNKTGSVYLPQKGYRSKRHIARFFASVRKSNRGAMKTPN